MRETLAAFCAQTGRRGLVEQWCAARNAPLAPGQVSYGSKRKVWWRCDRGHTWQASVCARTGSGSSVQAATHSRATAAVMSSYRISRHCPMVMPSFIGISPA